MAIVLPCRSKQPVPDGITGAFFWEMPAVIQRRRIRELADANVSIKTISSICRMPLTEVAAIIEARRA